MWMSIVFAACMTRTAPDGDDTAPRRAPDDRAFANTAYTRLGAEDAALRVSMALRGKRPSEDERDRVLADPDALGELVDTWIASDEFGATVRDMWAEVLLVRNDVDYANWLGTYGPLEGSTGMALFESASDEPLRIVERVVREGRPLTEIVTADWTMADANLAEAYGLAYDDGGDVWQESAYTDGRPLAGVLSTNAFWLRHQSNGSNYHRGRANAISRALLCEDFLARDISIDGSVDLSDDEAVADAVSNNPSCVSCHQSLDPLASNAFGFRTTFRASYTKSGYNADCTGSYARYCYPLQLWMDSETDDWESKGLRSPGYYGTATDDLGDVGDLIAADPRFAQCMARRFEAWLTETEPEDVDFERAARRQQQLVDSGWDARVLVRDVVLSDAFLSIRGGPAPDAAVGVLVVRPEQHARNIEDLTGFAWVINDDDADCAEDLDCWGDVNLLTSDRYGFRAMAGGIDGSTRMVAAHEVSPMRLLAIERVAYEAAGWVVDRDLAEADRAARKLLHYVEADTTDEEDVRVQLAWLHRRVLWERLDPYGAEIDETYALWDEIRVATGDVPTAWKAVIAGLLQDDRILFY